MINRKTILMGFLFLALFILIELFLPDFFSNKVVSYLVIGIGYVLWYHSIKNQLIAGIFAGSFIFFSGVILFVNSSFVIWNPSRMVLPALVISLGLSSFFTFIFEKKIFYLIFSVVFFLLGFNFLYARMSFKFSVFVSSIPQIFLGIGIFLSIITAILFYFLKKEAGVNNEEIKNQASEENKIEI